MKPFIITGDTFPFDCIVGLGTKSELLRFCAKYFSKKEVDGLKKNLENMKVARHLTLGPRSVIFYPKFENTPNCVSVLMHELLHYTFFTMYTAGIPYTEDSEEAFTYFLQNVSHQALKHINNQSKSPLPAMKSKKRGKDRGRDFRTVLRKI